MTRSGTRPGAGLVHVLQRVIVPTERKDVWIQQMAGAVGIAVALGLCWWIVWPRLIHSDVFIYHRYAVDFWTGHPPFHTLPQEYPPLAIIPFSLTLVPPVGDFHLVFAAWMGALALLGYVCFLRYSTPGRALVYAVYLVLGASVLFLARFDLFPALLTVAALWAAQRRRYGLAYVLLAIGILLKLYPGFLVPALMIDQWRTLTTTDGEPGRGSGPRWAFRRISAGVALCALVVMGGFLAAAVLNPTVALSTFAFNAPRPLQVESTPASLLWLGTFVGIPAHAAFSHNTLNLVGPLDAVLIPGSLAALLAGCCWIYWRQARGKLSLGRAFLACLCVVIASNKIFSPQYIIWVLPVAAAVDGLDAVWVLICVFCVWEFPFLYRSQATRNVYVLGFSWQFMLVLVLRNGLMVFAAVRAIVRRPASLATAPIAAAPAAGVRL